MKLLAALATVTCLLTAMVRAGGPDLLATVRGTVTVEEAGTGIETHPSTSKLNNSRIFQEFGVSDTDYALVYRSQLKLVGRRVSDGLPTIVVYGGVNGHLISNSAKETGRLLGAVGSPAVAGLFKDRDGVEFGKVKFPPDDKYKVHVIAAGTNPTPTTINATAHLSFQVVTGAAFIPQ